ncbi:HD-GYP domain-containing protein [Butyribacter sp.]|uniref:HD-GYP domain-containing protein n=1 Tax=Butyribacter sp. TaxID=2822465 RepID=UPI002A95273F|nr:response regulator [Butyribacter sp.]
MYKYEKDWQILVVDDKKTNLMLAEKILQEEFNVSMAQSGTEAIAFLEKNIVDLVLLDLHMPDMNGFEVMSEIRHNENITVDLPVIFLTADDDKAMEVRSFKEGAQDFIAKPFVPEIMIQRVRRVIQLDKLQKNLQDEIDKQTRKAEEKKKQFQRLSIQVMQSLAGAIDAKDRYTKGHSQRVAMYSREIAGRYGYDEEKQEDVYFAGMLHDIGKIGIPNEIINKTGKLTDEEYEILKTHPSIGGDILSNISEIPNIAIGARWHHERYDGKGYPDGLRGKDIPELARIIGVADAYDAMTSKRSYRDVLSQEIVRLEIKKGKGTQFDPVFAEIMLEMIDEDKNYDMHEK